MRFHALQKKRKKRERRPSIEASRVFVGPYSFGVFRTGGPIRAPPKHSLRPPISRGPAPTTPYWRHERIAGRPVSRQSNVTTAGGRSMQKPGTAAGGRGAGPPDRPRPAGNWRSQVIPGGLGLPGCPTPGPVRAVSAGRSRPRWLLPVQGGEENLVTKHPKFTGLSRFPAIAQVRRPSVQTLKRQETDEPKVEGRRRTRPRFKKKEAESPQRAKDSVPRLPHEHVKCRGVPKRPDHPTRHVHKRKPPGPVNTKNGGPTPKQSILWKRLAPKSVKRATEISL